MGKCRLWLSAGVASEGEACGPLSGDGDILRLVGCSDGLVCVPTDDGALLPRACVRPGDLGEPCTRAWCAARLFCDAFGSRTCVPATVIAPVPIGAPCVEDGAYTRCIGQWGTTCVGGVCIAARGEGQPCNWGWDDFHDSPPASLCDATLYCDSDDTCRPALEVGSVCEWDLNCLSICCLPEELRCASEEECRRLRPCR